MTDDTEKKDVALILGWDDLGAAAGLRRNDAGFGDIKKRVTQTDGEKPLKLNAFFYAFLFPAKNFDLFLSEDFKAVEKAIGEIEKKIRQLLEFERTACDDTPTALRNSYLALREVIGRGTARDERRTLATLLFSGPSTAEQVARELGITANLVDRMFLALSPVLESSGEQSVALRADTNSLAVVLYLLRSTLGVDPIAVLRRRIDAQKPARG